MKNFILKILLIMSFLPTIVSATNDVELTYSVPETEGEAIFHLDTTLVSFSDEELEKDINYHVTTKAGNYYIGNGYKQYSVIIYDNVLTDIHGNDIELPVYFNNNQAQGTLNLNNTVEDNTTYAGRVISTTESTDVAGEYSTSVIVNFNVDDKLTKLASNVYAIHRGVTEETNYVEVPGISEGTTVADFKENFLNEEGVINVYDKNGNLIEDDNTIVTTAMSVQLENVTSASTFSFRARAVNVINDQLGIAVPGDVDGDGELTGGDYGIILNDILGKDVNFLYLKAADLNKDGNISVADSTKFMNFYYAANQAKIDEPLLDAKKYKTYEYNGIKYYKASESASAYNLNSEIILNVNDYQYEDIDGNLITQEETGYWEFDVVMFNHLGEEIPYYNYTSLEKRKAKFTTGTTFKIAKFHLDEEYNLLSIDNYYYDSLLFVLDGDVNSDAVVDENDITYLTQALNGEVNLTTAQRLAADRNNDGIINQSDLDIYNN